MTIGAQEDKKLKSLVLPQKNPPKWRVFNTIERFLSKDMNIVC